MHLNLVVQFLSDQRPGQSLDIKERLKHIRLLDSLLHWHGEGEVEEATESIELLLEDFSQLFVQHGSVGPCRRHEHNVPHDVSLGLFEWVVHGVFVAEVKLTVVFETIDEGVEDDEELKCERLHVPEVPLLDQWLLVQLVHKLQHELLRTLFKVTRVHTELRNECSVLLLHKLKLAIEQVLRRDICLLSVNDTNIRQENR